MNKIYIGNLSYKTTEANLRDAFAQFGTIADAVIIKERDTGRSKGFGFITFETEKAADQALVMEGKELDGRTLRVNLAKEREAGGAGGGRGGDSRGGRGGDSRGDSRGGNGGGRRF